MGDNSSYLQFFNLFFEVCLVFFLLVSIGCIVKLWQLKITLAQVCKSNVQLWKQENCMHY